MQTPLEIIGGLSAPSKMPGTSWSISAFECKTGSKLREVKGSTCSDCYACKGNYRFKNVKDAHERRLKALQNPGFVDAFVSVLTNIYNKTKLVYMYQGQLVKENRHRWHDSGDLQDLEHLIKINEIALRTPFISHWLPTREFGIVNEFLKKGYSIAPNLTIRMSAVMQGQGFKTRPMGLPFSTVGVEDSTVEQCRAPSQGGKCLDCRACWDQDKDINYKKH